MKRLARLKEVLLKITDMNLISRDLAKEVDELTDGAVSRIAHINSFTEAHSNQHVDAIKVILEAALSSYDIKLDAEETKNLLRSMKRRRNDLEDSFRIKISVSTMMKILSGDLSIGDDKIVDMTAHEVVEHSDELNELFGKDLSTSKLSVSADEYGDVVKVKVYDVVNKTKLDSHIKELSSTIEHIENMISDDVELVIDNRSKVFQKIHYYNNDLLCDLAEFVLSLIEDQKYFG